MFITKKLAVVNWDVNPSQIVIWHIMTSKDKHGLMWPINIMAFKTKYN